MVDTSGSMNSDLSRDGSLMRWDAAALFGTALGRACAAADVVSYSSGPWNTVDSQERTQVFPLTAGGSVLGDLRRWREGGRFLGRGTETAASLRERRPRPGRRGDRRAGRTRRHRGRRGGAAGIPMYTWNLAGRRTGHAPSGTADRHTFGG